MRRAFGQLVSVVPKINEDPFARKLVGGVLVGGACFYLAYPTLYKWELLPFVTTDAYRAKQSLIDYSNLDGIVYDPYDKGSTPPRSEMLPTSRGKMIIK